jgi:hemolysin activation/secretion protein
MCATAAGIATVQPGGYKFATRNSHAFHMAHWSRPFVRSTVALSLFAGIAESQETGLPLIAPETQPSLAQPAAVVVKGFRFEGNTVFKDAQLLAAPVVIEQVEGKPVVRSRVSDYVNKPLTTEGLELVREALTRLYIGAGYINSGAVLPDQDVVGGVILFRIVEGKLTDVNLTGNKRLRNNYVISRVKRGGKSPLNILRLRNQLELIRQNPNLTRVNAELRPGAEPGEAYLDVQIAESNPFQIGLQVSNRRSPAVGAEQVEILASHRNLTGNGDVLAVRYGVNTGGFDNWEWAGSDDFSIDYTIPITPADTTLTASVTRTDSIVVEEPFDQLDITSQSNSVALTLRHPFYRAPNAEFAMFAGLGYRDNQTELLGQPFSFSPGAEDGESVVAPIRLGQEFNARSQVDAFALRSTFSIGTTLFGATQNGGSGADGTDIPDAQYVAWLGQLQYVRRLNPQAVNPLRDYQLVLRGSAQLASDRLLSIEQFALGGIDTVRGYRENQIVRDIGAAGSVEFHIPLIATASGNRILEFVPFVDLGYGENEEGDTLSETLSSIGAGIVWTPNRHVNAQLYYGYALNRDVNEETDDLQDAGIHFNILVLAF